MDTYQPRPVTGYGTETISGWPVKVHGLAVTGRPTAELVDAARELAGVVLAEVPEQPRAAYVIAHQARPACFVLVCWWSTPVDLCLRYFRSLHAAPAVIEPMPDSSMGCIWELALIEHERIGWVRHVLTDEPDLAAHLDEAAPDHV